MKCRIPALVAAVVVPSVFAGEPIDDPIPAPLEQGDITIRLRPVLTGIVAPNWGTFPPGNSTWFFVTDQVGIVHAINLDTGESIEFLDVSSHLVPLGAFGPGTFDERGLLGIAFHPDYSQNGRFYTFETHPFDAKNPIEADFSTLPDGVNPNSQTVIMEYTVPDPWHPDSVADPEAGREIMRIDKPQFNHNGGTLAFGPDDMLYISLGDGGASDDQAIGHSPQGNGQDMSNVLGDILRIDPLGDNSANDEYGIPADNPFVGVAGVAEEIFISGVRNPFRVSFDAKNGDFYIADVGQGAIEELTIGTSGDNLGWRVKEGTFLFDPAAQGQPGFVFQDSPGSPPELTDPIAQYDHDEGISIIGGFVYHGSGVPGLQHHYVCGDYSQNNGGNNGRLFYLDENNEFKELIIEGQEELGLSVLGFGQDADGEVYVMANATGIPSGETGVVLRISPPCPADVDFDFIVGSTDLNAVLAGFGCTDGDCSGDIDGDGDTDSTDLNLILADFGDECG